MKVYRTVHLSGLATPEIFEEWGEAAGLELVEFDETFSPNLGYHYQHVSTYPPPYASDIDRHRRRHRSQIPCRFLLCFSVIRSF